MASEADNHLENQLMGSLTVLVRQAGRSATSIDAPWAYDSEVPAAHGGIRAISRRSAMAKAEASVPPSARLAYQSDRSAIRLTSGKQVSVSKPP